MAASAGDQLGLPYLIWGQRARIVFPIMDADGDLVAGATGLDSELSQDQGTFADATNEATQIATSSGMYFLDLVSTETDCSTVAAIVKSTEGKTTALVLPVRRLPVLRAGTAQAGAAGTITLDSGASAKDDFYNGCIIQCVNDTPSGVIGQTRWITDYVGSTKVATVHSNWGTNPSSSTTFEVYVPDTAGVGAWLGKQLADPVDGVPDVNVTHTFDAALSSANVPGNVKAINDVAESSVRLQEGVDTTTKFVVGSGSTSTAVVMSSVDPSSQGNGQFAGQVISFSRLTTSTALRGQKAIITAWDHATATATVSPALNFAPVSGDKGTFQ